MFQPSVTLTAHESGSVFLVWNQGGKATPNVIATLAGTGAFSELQQKLHIDVIKELIDLYNNKHAPKEGLGKLVMMPTREQKTEETHD
jgi:hypothetical protein